MALKLFGSVEAKRIYHYITKTLGSSDLSNYELLIDKTGNKEAYKISIKDILDRLNDVDFNDLDSTSKKVIDAINEILALFPSITDDGSDVAIDANLGVSGQAHSGSHIQTFAATTTFNANNGTNQYMLVTGDCTINISNLNVGVMTIKLKNSGGGHTVTIGSSFGDPMDDIAELKTADVDTNTIMVIRGADNTYEYTINGITA
jgi:hypothetical protein